MDDDSKAEQFKILLRSAKGSSVIDCISRAISEPGLFVFGELVALPSVQQLKDTADAKVFNTLELFAYGTWTEQKENPGLFMELNERQQKKLKQLTMCSLAQKQKALPYQFIIEQLNLSSMRELEDFVVQDCMYPGLIKGKLDQKERCLRVQDVIPRDVRPEHLPIIMTGLNNWLLNINKVMADLAGNVSYMGETHKCALQADAKFNDEMDKLKKSVEKSDMLALDDARMMLVMDEGHMGGPEAPPVPSMGRYSSRNIRSAVRSMPDQKRRK